MYLKLNSVALIKCIFVVLIYISTQAFAANTLEITATQPIKKQDNSAYIALIIDDLGYHPKNDLRAILLNAKITYAFLPHTPHAKRLATMAHQQGNEVILHLPMESEQAKAQEPDVLTREMDKEVFTQILEKSLLEIPYISGLNNHMGSALTQSQQHMDWLMSALQTKQLFFIDSRTTSRTVAEKLAQQYQIPNSRRDVFLDHVRSKEAIKEQYQRLIKLAKKNGSAIAIGHPFSITLKFLEEKLPELEKNNIKLVSVKELIKIQNHNKNNKHNLTSNLNNKEISQ
ncbi:MAG: divergent polysaccharide deacetylase family protein [Pseudomonadota bacterium]